MIFFNPLLPTRCVHLYSNYNYPEILLIKKFLKLSSWAIVEPSPIVDHILRFIILSPPFVLLLDSCYTLQFSSPIYLSPAAICNSGMYRNAKPLFRSRSGPVNWDLAKLYGFYVFNLLVLRRVHLNHTLAMHRLNYFFFLITNCCFPRCGWR